MKNNIYKEYYCDLYRKISRVEKNALLIDDITQFLIKNYNISIDTQNKKKLNILLTTILEKQLSKIQNTIDINNQNKSYYSNELGVHEKRLSFGINLQNEVGNINHYIETQDRNFDIQIIIVFLISFILANYWKYELYTHILPTIGCLLFSTTISIKNDNDLYNQILKTIYLKHNIWSEKQFKELIDIKNFKKNISKLMNELKKIKKTIIKHEQIKELTLEKLNHLNTFNVNPIPKKVKRYGL